MDTDILFVLLMPAAGLGLTTWLFYWLCRNAYQTGMVLAGAIWFFFTLFMFFGFLGGQGLDGLAYLVALCGISPPIAVGAVIGGLLGLRKKEDRINA